MVKKNIGFVGTGVMGASMAGHKFIDSQDGTAPWFCFAGNLTPVTA